MSHTSDSSSPPLSAASTAYTDPLSDTTPLIPSSQPPPHPAPRHKAGKSGSKIPAEGDVASGEESEVAKVERKRQQEDSSLLLWAFVAMTVIGLGNRIFGKLQTIPMHDYPFFSSLLSVFIYVPICFMYIIPAQCMGKISQAEKDIPRYKFAIMGGLDCLTGLMSTFALNYIPNASLVVLLGQASIPISMLISKMFLKAKYTYEQYTGAGIVMLGIVVVLIPEFMKKADAGGGDVMAQPTKDSSNQGFWIGVQMVSIIPGVFSNVYKEKALGELDIDVTYLNGWVSLFQFLFAIPLVIPSAWASNLTVKEIPGNLYDGARCTLGYNTISFSDTADPSIIYHDCTLAPFYTASYLFFNLALNILIVLVLKHGSAAILAMSSTVLVPLGNFAFSLDFMPGHKPQRPTDVAGLGIIMMGLLFFRYLDKMLKACGVNLDEGTGKPGKISRSQSRQEDKAERKVIMKSAAFVGLAGGATGIDRPVGEVFLSTLIRAEKARAVNLFRSPAQVRGSFLFKLGVQPSPQVGYGTGGGGSRQGTPGFIGSSPALIGDRMLARMEEKKREKASQEVGMAAYKRTNSMSPNLSNVGGEGGKKKKKEKKKKGRRGGEDLV